MFKTKYLTATIECDFYRLFTVPMQYLENIRVSTYYVKLTSIEFLESIVRNL